MIVASPGFIDMDAAFIRLRRDIEYQIRKWVSCPETAADLTTDLYLKLKRVSPLCRTEAEAWTYLRKMARTAAIDHIRSAKRRREILAEYPIDQHRETPTPEVIVTAQREAEIVAAAVAELPSRMQDMLYMSRMLDMTYAEIATEFGVSRSLTEKVVAEALVHCRDRLRAVAEWEAARQAAPAIERRAPVKRMVGGLRAAIWAKRS